MSRDIEPERPEFNSANQRDARLRPNEPRASRDHDLVRLRGYLYRTSPAERELLHDIGRFRAVALADLGQHLYRGDTARLRQDLNALRAQGLIQTRTFWSGPGRQKLTLVALTKQGKKLMESGEPRSSQALYAGFVKPAEVRHDAAIYRMYQAEREAIERAGGRVRRVVLDYELKLKVYRPLSKARSLPPLDFARRQTEVAQQNGLKLIQGKIPLPDLRIEYETTTGDLAHVDLELATGHYHGPALQSKAEAGFKFYAADGSASRLSRVMEEREITASILSI